MENEFVIPARPWTDADVAFLTHNAGFLPEDIRAELGLTPPTVDNDFQADFDAGKQVDESEDEDESDDEDDEVDTPETESVVEEVPALPTDVDGAVVDNTATDNA